MRSGLSTMEKLQKVDINPRIYNGPWSSKELQTLRQMAQYGAETIAGLLGRSVASVQRMAYRQRVSLRPKGERRGRVLGEPRDISFRQARALGEHLRILEQLRSEVLEGKVDPSRLESEVRRRAAVAAGAELCPGCTRNPQETPTGFCRDCHLKSLADAHRHEEIQKAAQRDLWRERQRKVRRNKAAARNGG